MPAPRTVLAVPPPARDGVLPPDLVGRLRRAADLDPRAGADDLRHPGPELAAAEVLITGWGTPRIGPEVLRAAPRLRAVVHAAGSVKRYVDPEVLAAGVLVSSAAAANAVPVADYTEAVVLLAGKRALSRARWYAGGVPRGDWSSGAGTGLTGRTVGVLGASRVGRLVLGRLRDRGFRLLLSDPYVTGPEARRLGAEPVALDDLFRRSDVLTLHAPALPATRHVADRYRLGLMPEGATLVNTARGSLVDTDALLQRCSAGRLHAVLDVTDPEPLPPDHPLLHLPTVTVTPHLAGAQGHELRLLGEFAVSEVERLAAGLPLQGRVLADELDRIA